MNFDDVRRYTITALFSDDVLFEQLALKGGNAMSLVHCISSRTSLDLDFSMDKDFENIDRIFKYEWKRALASRFAPFQFRPV